MSFAIATTGRRRRASAALAAGAAILLAQGACQSETQTQPESAPLPPQAGESGSQSAPPQGAGQGGPAEPTSRSANAPSPAGQAGPGAGTGNAAGAPTPDQGKGAPPAPGSGGAATPGQGGGAPPAPGAGGAGGAGEIDVSDEEVQAFAAAYPRIIEIQKQAQGELRAAENEKQAAEIKKQAQAEVVEVVKEEGLSLRRFDRIGRALQRDPELRRRVKQEIQSGQ